MIPLLVGLALADVPVGGDAPSIKEERFQFGVSQGVEGVINDPFLRRTGLRHGFHFAPSPWVELGGAFVWFPVLGEGGADDPDWTPLAKQLLLENSVSPDISKLELEGQLTVAVLPFRAQLGAWESRVGFLAGAAVVSTKDDLVALQAENEPDALATENQVHPASVFGVQGDVRMKWFGVRLRAERVRYIEVVNSTVLEAKSNSLIGAEVIVWFP